jgi:hypothetical protein
MRAIVAIALVGDSLHVQSTLILHVQSAEPAVRHVVVGLNNISGSTKNNTHRLPPSPQLQ